MNQKKKRWTNEEEQVLIDQVRQNPSNLSNAFRATSKIIGRSEGTIRYYWYHKVRLSNTVFMTISSNTNYPNRKISRDNTVNNTKCIRLSIWRRILALLGL